MIMFGVNTLQIHYDSQVEGVQHTRNHHILKFRTPSVLVLVLQRNRTNNVYVNLYIIYYKEFSHAIIEAAKFQHLQSAS